MFSSAAIITETNIQQLFASVFLADPTNNEKMKAKQALERAVKQEAGHLNAVFLLTGIYSEEKNIDKAIEM